MQGAHDGGRQPSHVLEKDRGLKLPPGVRATPEDSPYGRDYLYKEGEVLVLEEDLPLVADRLEQNSLQARSFDTAVLRKRFGDVVADIDDLGVVRYELGSGANLESDDLPALVAELRSPVPVWDGNLNEFVPRFPRVFPHIVVPLTGHAPWHPATPPGRTPPLRPLPPRNGSSPGTGVTIALLETGVDPANLEWFDGRIEIRGPKDHDRLPVAGPNDPRPFACGGHGMHVAGVVAQCAPGAQIVVRRIPGDNPSYVEDATLASAIRAVAEPDNGREIDIMNLSLGSPTHDNSGLPLTEAAIDDVLRKHPGMAIVASAGNAQSDAPNSPAAFKGVFRIAALRSARPPYERAWFSNWGRTWVDACARGQNVRSAFLRRGGFDVLAEWNGTSFSAPASAAAVAVGLSPEGQRSSSSARTVADQLVSDPGAPRVEGLGTVVTPRSHVG